MNNINSISLLSLVFSIFLIAGNCYADEIKANQYLFDNNCKKLALDKQYIRGKEDRINDLSARSERYFVWEKINRDYKNLVNRVSTVATDIQNNTNGSLTHGSNFSSCDFENPREDNQACLGFISYCTEQIALKGMEDELTKWQTKLTNCSHSEFKARHISYCQKDASASLNYLENQASLLAQTYQDKESNKEASHFFNEAHQMFSAFESDKAALANAKAQNKDKLDHQAKQAQTLKHLDFCRQLLANDSSDINSRKIESNLVDHLITCGVPQDSLMPLNQLGLTQLEKQINQIDQYSFQNKMLEDITTEALKKSVLAYLNAYDLFINEQDKEQITGKDQNAFLERFCLAHKNSSVELCAPGNMEIILSAFDQYKKDKNENAIGYIKDEQIQQELNHSFNPLIQSINRTCRDSQKAYDKINSLYTCGPQFDFSFNDSLNMQMEDSEIKIGDAVMKLPMHIPKLAQGVTPTAQNCEHIDREKYQMLTKLQNLTNIQSQRSMQSLTTSKLGGLIITQSMKDKMNYFDDEDWVYKRCFKGEAKALNTLDLNTINTAKNQMVQLVSEEIDNVLLDRDSNYPDKTIRQYLKTHPLTITDLLMENPSQDYANQICRYVRDIYDDDVFKRNRDIAVGGVMLAGAIVLAIPSAGTSLGVVAGSTIAVGSGAEIYFQNNRLKDADYQKTRITGASSTLQMQLDQALDSIDLENQKRKDAKFARNLSVVFASLDLVTFGGGKLLKSFMQSSKMPGILKTLKVTDQSITAQKSFQQSVNRGLELLNQSTQLNPSIINQLPEEEIVYLAVLVNHLDDTQRLQFFQKLSQLDNPAQIKKFLNLMNAENDIFTHLKGDRLNFEMISKNINSAQELELPFGVNINQYFTQAKKMNAENINAHLLQTHEDYPNPSLSQEVNSWFRNSNTRVDEDTQILSKLELHLTDNKVTFIKDQKGSAFELKGDDQSALGKFVQSLEQKGVKVIYDPEFLKKNHIGGMYDPETSSFYIGHKSILKLRPSTEALHEATHWKRSQNYISGIDDQYNLVIRSQREKIYLPPEEFLQKYEIDIKNIPYATYFSLEEVQTYAKNLRQALLGGKIDTKALDNAVKYSRFSNELTIYRAQTLEKEYLRLKQTPSLINENSFWFEKQMVNGVEKFVAKLRTFSKPHANARGSSAYDYEMILVTSDQVELAKSFQQGNSEAAVKLIEQMSQKMNIVKNTATDMNQYLDEIWNLSSKIKEQGHATEEQFQRLIDLTSKSSGQTRPIID